MIADDLTAPKTHCHCRPTLVCRGCFARELRAEFRDGEIISSVAATAAIGPRGGKLLAELAGQPIGLGLVRVGSGRYAFRGGAR